MSEQASNLPTLEPVWLVEAVYVANAVEARAPFRSAHLARLLELKERGVVVEAGAYADVSASVLDAAGRLRGRSAGVMPGRRLLAERHLGRPQGPSLCPPPLGKPGSPAPVTLAFVLALPFLPPD